jgi:predicted ribosome quality control (RQC) complex YloA/Tae2 family protein
MAFDGVFTHYLVNELQANLLSGRINKIYQVSNYELVFVIRANNKTQKCLLSIHPVYSRCQITESDFIYPQEPPMFCMLLRKHLEGGIIKSITQKDNDRIILFDIEYLNEIGDRDQKQLIIEIMGKHSNIILLNKETNKIIDCIKHISPFQNSYRTLQPGADYIFPPSNDKINFFQASITDFEKFKAESPTLTKDFIHYFEGVSPILANELIKRAITITPIGLYNAYQNLIQTLEQNLEPTIIETESKTYYYLINLLSVEGEKKTFDSISSLLDRFYFKKDAHERIRQQTQDLEKFIKNELDKNINKLSHLNHDLIEAEKADELKLYGELIITYSYQIEKGMKQVEVENYYTNQMIHIQLDPLLTPIENSQKYYAKYQKAKKAIHHIHEQIALTKQEIEYFDTLYQQIQSANLNDALEIRMELEDLRYLRKRKSKQKKKAKLQYETIQLDGAVIFVGKNNMQNDYLTFKHANKEDTWMHAKDMPGSHVIIRTEELTEEIIRTGAQLASYYSKGKQSSSVPIDYTLIKHVKKIPGAKPGFVTYDHQKTIYIDPDEDFIHKLTQA